jgi:hypothetical protein
MRAKSIETQGVGAGMVWGPLKMRSIGTGGRVNLAPKIRTFHPPFDRLERRSWPALFLPMSTTLRLFKACSSAVAVSRTRAGKHLSFPHDHTTLYVPFHSDDPTIRNWGDLLFNNRGTLELGQITLFARTYAAPDTFRFHFFPSDHELVKWLWEPVGGPFCAHK